MLRPSSVKSWSNYVKVSVRGTELKSDDSVYPIFLKNVMQLRKECGCILSLQNTS